MNLQDYARLILPDANCAKNHISYLIGYLDKSENAGKGILGLFDNLPDTYRDKKLFSPIIQKFFVHYRINDENVKYYNEFSSLWKAHEIEEVKLKNPHWQWDKTQYKNSLEFVKALSSRENQGKNYTFIEENKDTFLKLLKKDANKLSANMSKYQVWRALGAEMGYSAMVEFVDNYQFNKNEVIKEAFLNNSFTMINLLEKSEPEEFNSFCYDLCLNKDFFKDTDFLSNRHEKRTGNQSITVLDYYFMALAEDKIVQSFNLLDKFLPEIEISLSSYHATNKNANIYEKLEKVGKYICAQFKERRYSREECCYISHDKLEPKLQHLKTYLFKEKLDNEVISKDTKTPKRKI